MQTTRQVKRMTKGTGALALVTLAVGLTAVVAVTTAAAGPKPPAPPAPTITSGPSGTSTSKNATFTYTDSLAGVTFKCSLDGTTFATCPSTGITYTGLAEGSHTFRVAAQNGNSNLSSSTGRTWVVDTRPPVIGITFPAAGGFYRAGAWNAGCSPTGICGAATDSRGVASVRVAVRRHSSGKYWNGSAFAATSALFNTASGASSWRYALALPADGAYTVYARATDGVGNATAAADQMSRTFTVDTVAPPAPVITKSPDDPTSKDNAHFAFSDAEPAVSFACALDDGTPSSCGSNVEYSQLAVGEHCFRVTAADRAGNVSTPTSFCWTIVVDKDFEVTGSTELLFHPGRTQSVNLAIGNPFNFDLKVIGVSIVVEDETTKDGSPNPDCVGSDNLVVSREFGGPVIVPRNATRSLQQLGVHEDDWPQLHMPDLPVNQDGCKRTTFKLTYTGVGTKP